VPYMVKIS